MDQGRRRNQKPKFGGYYYGNDGPQQYHPPPHATIPTFNPGAFDSEARSLRALAYSAAIGRSDGDHPLESFRREITQINDRLISDYRALIDTMSGPAVDEAFREWFGESLETIDSAVLVEFGKLMKLKDDSQISQEIEKIYNSA